MLVLEDAVRMKGNFSVFEVISVQYRLFRNKKIFLFGTFFNKKAYTANITRFGKEVPVCC